jgi:two-component system OmpR family response regulator
VDALPRILVVDDDAEIRTLLADYLEANGYAVRAVGDGPAMWDTLAAATFDLVVLDVSLPGDDGLALCRMLRSRSALPIVMLTARGELVDRVLGLEMGADDYVAKAFEPRELLARIRSVLRRSRTPHEPQREARRLRLGTWQLDVAVRHLLSANGTIVALSGAEFRLLSVGRTPSRRASPRRRRQRRQRELGRPAIDVSLHGLRATVPHALHGRCRRSIRGADVGRRRRTRSGRPDVLKVGHHGSAYSSTPGFIAAVRPRYALISAGRRNPLGHPLLITLATLQRLGTTVYRTDRCGAISVEAGPAIAITPMLRCR